MDEEAYNRFVDLDRVGRRRESKIAVRQFLDSFVNLGERDAWARKFLQQQQYFDQYGQFGIRVRNEIFEEALWPYLLNGCRKDDPDCLFWLAALGQNLASRKDLNSELKQSSYLLLKRAFGIEKNNIQIRSALLDVVIYHLKYSFHEWPCGVLYDTTSADIEQINEIQEDIFLASELDVGKLYFEKLKIYGLYLNIYRKRIMPQ